MSTAEQLRKTIETEFAWLCRQLNLAPRKLDEVPKGLLRDPANRRVFENYFQIN